MNSKTLCAIPAAAVALALLAGCASAPPQITGKAERTRCPHKDQPCHPVWVLYLNNGRSAVVPERDYDAAKVGGGYDSGSGKVLSPSGEHAAQNSDDGSDGGDHGSDGGDSGGGDGGGGGGGGD
jgi:uncharacterized membrane protein YgcG